MYAHPRPRRAHRSVLTHARPQVLKETRRLSLIDAIKSSTSLANQEVTFEANATGRYVTAAPNTAKIVEGDILTDRGVVHVIDRVLFTKSAILTL